MMFLNVFDSEILTKNDVKEKNINSIVELGTNILYNSIYGTKNKIDYIEFLKIYYGDYILDSICDKEFRQNEIHNNMYLLSLF